jgi:hypothetical protein
MRISRSLARRRFITFHALNIDRKTRDEPEVITTHESPDPHRTDGTNNMSRAASTAVSSDTESQGDDSPVVNARNVHIAFTLFSPRKLIVYIASNLGFQATPALRQHPRTPPTSNAQTAQQGESSQSIRSRKRPRSF